MADESGGDFGGGSVTWKVTFPDNSLTAPIATHPDNPHRKQARGVDDRPGLTTFYLVLKNTPGGTTPSLKDRLQAAANLLAATTPPNEVVIELPIQSGRTIRVLWERPHHPLI